MTLVPGIYLFIYYLLCVLFVWVVNFNCSTAVIAIIHNGSRSRSPLSDVDIVYDCPLVYNPQHHLRCPAAQSYGRAVGGERGKQVYITRTACLYFKRSTHGYETETFLPHVSARLWRRQMRSSDGLCYESNRTKSGPCDSIRYKI